METKFPASQIAIAVTDCTNPVFENPAMVYAYIEMAKACWEAYWSENFQMFSGVEYPAYLKEDENKEVNNRLQAIMVGFSPVTITRY